MAIDFTTAADAERLIKICWAAAKSRLRSEPHNWADCRQECFCCLLADFVAGRFPEQFEWPLVVCRARWAASRYRHRNQMVRSSRVGDGFVLTVALLDRYDHQRRRKGWLSESALQRRRDLVEEAVAALPPDMETVIRYRFGIGLPQTSLRRVAKLLTWSPAQVRRVQNRARTRLKRCLTAAGVLDY